MTILTMRLINPICNLKQNCQNFKISPVFMLNELKHLMTLSFFSFCISPLFYCYSLRVILLFSLSLLLGPS